MRTLNASGMLMLVICLLSLRGFAQDVIQPRDIARIETVTSAQIQPGGSAIAYTISVPRKPWVEEDGPARTHLMVAKESGTRTFVGGETSVRSVHWSRDGMSIFFLSKRHDDKNTCLYQIPIDGGEAARVLSHPTSVSSYSIHPDGDTVAFLAAEDKPADAKEAADKGFNQHIYEEDWAYTQLWLASLKDEAPPRVIELPGSAMASHWNHSGSHLAVVLAPTPSVDDSYMAKQVYVVDAKSGEVTKKLEHRSKLGAIAWSPNDEYLAMIAGRDIHDPKDGRLLLANVSQDEVVDLMPDYEAHVTSFAFHDDNSIVWTADEGTLSRVGHVDLTGAQSTLISPSPEIGAMGGLSLPQGHNEFSVVIDRRDHPAEVYRRKLSSANLVRVTHSNPWLSALKRGRQETITWKASDGLEIQGVLVYPTAYQQGQRYPMIMVVHGGPESHESDGWMTSYSRPGQMAAARGFFVFYPNYRGSTGRGVEFSMLGQADAAGKEFSDLIDGIDYLVEAGLVDRSKVGITGGSYGGYASAWGATYYSDHFAASVMFVGISDNVSKVGTTDIPEEMFLVHHRKRLWDDWDYFLKSSPIRHVQKNKTPTLILHGEEDPRVHPSQSLELHRHLKTLGQAPVRLVLYQGEGHGNRKAAARFDYSLRQIRWMEHFLQNTSSAAPPMELDYQRELGISSDDSEDGSNE